MAILKSIANRVWNRGSLLAIAGLVISLITQFGFQVDSEKVMGIITTITTILVGLGILNDPTNGTKAYIPGVSDKLVEKKAKEEVKAEVNTTEVVENIVKEVE